MILEDAAFTPLSFGKMVLACTVVGHKLTALSAEGENIGVMLPSANGAMVTLFALQAFGRVPAMLNFTAGADGMLAACKVAGVATVLTSRVFIEKAKLQAVVERMEQKIRFVWLEDVRAGIGTRDKRAASFNPAAPAICLARSAMRTPPPSCCSPALRRRAQRRRAQPPQHPVQHRANRIGDRFQPDRPRAERAAALPLLRPHRRRPPAALRRRQNLPLPLAPAIPRHPRTRLRHRRHHRLRHRHLPQRLGPLRPPYDMRCMRYIFAGGEKLREETRRIYADRFGVRLLEGYGVTETSPVLALNTPMFSRPGSVGRLLPGMEFRLEPIEGVAEGGRLHVRGPNVMLGYLRTETPGVLEPPPDGWYDTGDIVTCGADRFITILGRAKRFAKVGGEMVSLAAADRLASELWPDALHAVVTVPDARKGEALVLAPTQQDATARALLAFARERGIAEIMVPRTVEVIDRMPLLGTGKIDIPSVQRLEKLEKIKAAAMAAQARPMAEAEG